VFFQLSNTVAFIIPLAFFCYKTIILSPASFLQDRVPIQLINQILLIWSIWPRESGEATIFCIGKASPAACLNLLIHFLGSCSTSKPEDKTVCIEAIIGTDDLDDFGKPFKPVQGCLLLETLLKKFYCSLPSRVLFTPGVRGTTQGIRWVPKSFLSCPSREDNFVTLENVVMPAMLETSPPGYMKVLGMFWGLVAYLNTPNLSLNYLTSATIQMQRTAFLRDDGLCCRLSGWVFKRSNRIGKNNNDVYIVGYKTDQRLVFWTFTRWHSLIDDKATLPDNWLEGSMAVL
jgi:hypothetical protein